jgi:hypothetical protein
VALDVEKFHADAAVGQHQKELSESKHLFIDVEHGKFGGE